jgi:hypothetical protein
MFGRGRGRQECLAGLHASLPGRTFANTAAVDLSHALGDRTPVDPDKLQAHVACVKGRGGESAADSDAPLRAADENSDGDGFEYNGPDGHRRGFRSRRIPEESSPKRQGGLLPMKAPRAEKEELIRSTVLINVNEDLADEADGALEPWTAPIGDGYHLGVLSGSQALPLDITLPPETTVASAVRKDGRDARGHDDSGRGASFGPRRRPDDIARARTGKRFRDRDHSVTKKRFQYAPFIKSVRSQTAILGVKHKLEHQSLVWIR